MKKIINSAKAPNPVGPYNQSVLCNGILFLSGQIAINAETGNIIDGTIEEETHQVLKNIGYVLNEAGLDYSDVVKCSVFVKDMELYGRINTVYNEYFDNDNAPARELVEVSDLPKYVKIEISCIADASKVKV